MNKKNKITFGKLIPGRIQHFPSVAVPSKISIRINGLEAGYMKKEYEFPGEGGNEWVISIPAFQDHWSLAGMWEKAHRALPRTDRVHSAKVKKLVKEFFADVLLADSK